MLSTLPVNVAMMAMSIPQHAAP